MMHFNMHSNNAGSSNPFLRIILTRVSSRQTSVLVLSRFLLGWAELHRKSPSAEVKAHTARSAEGKGKQCD